MSPLMPSLPLIVVALVFAASAGFGYLLRTAVLRRPFLDLPNHRSLHDAPVPRSGGLAIHAAFGLGAMTFMLTGQGLPGAFFWAGWLLVVTVSAWDDLRGLPVLVRLFAHLAGSVLLLWGLGIAQGALVLAVVALLSLAWFMNLFNFMDGMDGLAGLMAVTGAGTLASAAFIGAGDDLGWLLLAAAAAAAGFLVHNWPPARLFMGDAGSIGLGFLLGGLGLAGICQEIFPWYVPVLVFLPFILDASVTLLSRAIRGKRPWEAHREHAYQRLVLSGRRREHVLVIEFLFMLVCQTAALWLTMVKVGP